MSQQPAPIRRRARVSGVVQGVGFRPFVYNLALSLGLSGRVANNAAGVELAVQGPALAVEEFFRRLTLAAPPLARVDQVVRETVRPRPGEEGFRIEASRAGQRATLISPDAAVCQDCLAELFDPANRRYRYPFINCTHCGPRYTIIKDLPYDRPQTTMAAFDMCPQCQAEYQNPADRRFHAQPNACPVCGPRVWLAGPEGRELDCPDPIAAAAEALAAGKVLALKGLGGFHLAVDPFNQEAVLALRGRKHREEKPLALMARDLAAAERLVELDQAGREALASRQRPIVLAPARPGNGVAQAVAPGNRLLGVMLPYTPLHHLLMAEGFEALVMTSGNLSEEPICLDNREAVRRLGRDAPAGAIADLFLLHDRDIYLRADDSVVRAVGGALRSLRRSRGYAPAPILLPPGAVPAGAPPILAVGAHLKNTLCLLRGREAFLSQHVGDLANLEALEFFELTAGHLQRILDCRPRLIAVDPHPDYLCGRWAAEQGLPLVKVQHHHAHLTAVMAEHGLTGPVLGLAADGTGHGTDGTVWGCELMAAGFTDYRRLGRLRPLPLPGGEKAVREPWRVGLGLLLAALGPEESDRQPTDLLARHGRHLPLLAQMIESRLNTPMASSLGRLFDGAAAVAGLRFAAAYEGQAAVELEQALDPGESGAYAFALAQKGGLWELDWRPAIRELARDAAAGQAVGVISARFHHGLVKALAQWLGQAALREGLTQVVLGGGCFLNAHLLLGLTAALAARGLAVASPAAAPAGDGGIALGQAAAAAAACGGEIPSQDLTLGESDK